MSRSWHTPYIARLPDRTSDESPACLTHDMTFARSHGDAATGRTLSFLGEPLALLTKAI